MHLKLRQKRRPLPLRTAANAGPNCGNLLIYNDLTRSETDLDEAFGLAANVHLFSADKYGESTTVPKKVLIVDDSPSQVKLIQGLLEREGYWPVGLVDPKKVEETIATEHPGVILLDVVMPDRNGFQVCRDLKGNAEFSKIPVIMVTSKDSVSDRFWGEQQGADGYVTKPFTRDELLRAVRRFL